MHCATGASNTCDNTTSPSPVRFGFLLPRAFDVLDVFGPVEILQALSRQTHLELVLLGRTLEPVTTEPVSNAMNRFNSSFFPTVVPTHTYADNPPIDVLVIPGGAAARSPDLGPEIEYIRKVFPRLQYLITVCTGAGIAAQAGVLDGHRATTNKSAWKTITAMGPNVKWVSPARWVEDGKVWTSSGVTAGMDLTFEFIKQKYDNGTAIAEFAAGNMEHVMITDWRDDLGFGARFNVTPQN
ncbi:hypothetical protein C8A03DRAFT_30791 [Achaetomium macrosporum]|uniref:DJ-1/PfpI domain-containing protein n=1 Tax=Achaetomium macrosporum TaxID=79813 RepID=A0AAN7CFF5_9PEZI|nr:hypothetical protein C8A03DRAFT_30791 [Achaetomium macrosporum]